MMLPLATHLPTQGQWWSYPGQSITYNTQVAFAAVNYIFSRGLHYFAVGAEFGRVIDDALEILRVIYLQVPVGDARIDE
jgi:hypothetical protein